MKGFLVWHSTPFRKTHSLEELGETVLALDASFDPLVGRFVPLTEYAWCFRYPGEETDPDAIETREALEIATAVMNAILSRLPEAVHP